MALRKCIIYLSFYFLLSIIYLSSWIIFEQRKPRQTSDTSCGFSRMSQQAYVIAISVWIHLPWNTLVWGCHDERLVALVIMCTCWCNAAHSTETCWRRSNDRPTRGNRNLVWVCLPVFFAYIKKWRDIEWESILILKTAMLFLIYLALTISTKTLTKVPWDFFPPPDPPEQQRLCVVQLYNLSTSNCTATIYFLFVHYNMMGCTRMIGRCFCLILSERRWTGKFKKKKLLWQWHVGGGNEPLTRSRRCINSVCVEERCISEGAILPLLLWNSTTWLSDRITSTSLSLRRSCKCWSKHTTNPSETNGCARNGESEQTCQVQQLQGLIRCVHPKGRTGDTGVDVVLKHDSFDFVFLFSTKQQE